MSKRVGGPFASGVRAPAISSHVLVVWASERDERDVRLPREALALYDEFCSNSVASAMHVGRHRGSAQGLAAAAGGPTAPGLGARLAVCRFAV